MAKRFSKPFWGFLAVILYGFAFTGPARAEPIYEGLNLSLGISTWISSGETSWNHDASSASSIIGNPSSELTYEDQDSNVVEFNAELQLPNRFFIRGDVGFGSIDDGTLIDDDFLRASSGDFLASRSLSSIDGDGLWYFNIDIGYAILASSAWESSYLRTFIGYQHWNEKSEARGVTYDTCTASGLLLGICLAAGSSTELGTTVITNEVTWGSIRLGLDGKLSLTESLIIESSFAFIPYTDMENEDNHLLRTDLARPSFVMNGTGHGYNFDIKVSYQVVPKTFLSAGYKYWELNSDGDIESRGADGTNSTFPLNDLDSERYGFTLGLTYKF